jgi:hypothetical protein
MDAIAGLLSEPLSSSSSSSTTTTTTTTTSTSTTIGAETAAETAAETVQDTDSKPDAAKPAPVPSALAAMDSWDSVLRGRITDEPASDDPVHTDRRAVKEMYAKTLLSVPLSICSALRQLSVPCKGDVCLHLVGADVEEQMFPAKFREVLRCCPEITSLTLILVGPDINPARTFLESAMFLESVVFLAY